MKTTLKTNIKGAEITMEFEGSIKELFALNTSMVAASKEWLDLFQERGNQIFDLINAAIDRSAETSKKVILKDKEVNDFDKIVNPKKK